MSTTEQRAKAIRDLDALKSGDPEEAHGVADGILLDLVPEEVQDAWYRAHGRIGFWYA